MTTYPPTPGPPEPDPNEPERPDTTETGGTPFSGNQPGPTPPRSGGMPDRTSGPTPGETPRPPSEEPHSIPPAPPVPGTGPAAPPPASGGYSPYMSGAAGPPPPPPAANYGGGPMQGQEPRNRLGTAALVCGIIAVALSFIPALNAFTWPLGVLAIVFGAIGWNRANKGQATNKSIAITGLVLGILSFFTFCLIYIIIGAGSGSMYYDSAPML